MKTQITIFSLLCLITFGKYSTYAHSGHEHDDVGLRTWILQGTSESLEASFLMFRDGEVYLERKDHSVVHYPLNAFKDDDQKLLNEKIKLIREVNGSNNLSGRPENKFPLVSVFLGFLALAILILSFKFRITGMARTAAVSIFVLALLAGFRTRAFLGTDPEVIDKAFKPFKPAVNTFWDDNYFYVESKGIPNHKMMKGIVKWQQQVPIPQCYIGTNAWQIPLNPVIADIPVPVNDKHFLRGAVAIATNGVPIFNPQTNTGVDALEDGQLDIYGGHSGRADDYHYHIAPLQLHTLGQTALTNPIAYALDGFAVYGALEPDGSPMKPLDDNHGHFGTDGVYHYHGTAAKPYMIGNMVGKVTEDADLQLVPQPRANPVRPALTPLSGATITEHTINTAGNGYKLTYTRNNAEYAVDYSWSPAGKYTFNFISPSGTTTNVYNGFIQCVVPTAAEDYQEDNTFRIYPNPSELAIYIDLGDHLHAGDISSVVVFDQQGKTVYRSNAFAGRIDVHDLAKGVYFLQVESKGRRMARKIIIQ